MTKYVDSSSAYQRQIERMIFSEIQKSLGSDYIVVCDQEEYDQLTGNNMLAETIRQFDIHVLLIPLDEKTHETLREVMKRQSFL